MSSNHPCGGGCLARAQMRDAGVDVIPRQLGGSALAKRRLIFWIEFPEIVEGRRVDDSRCRRLRGVLVATIANHCFGATPSAGNDAIRLRRPATLLHGGCEARVGAG